MNGMRRDKLKRKVCGRLVRDGNAAAGRLSAGAGIMEGENYCGNLLWQSCWTFYPSFVNMSWRRGSGPRSSKDGALTLGIKFLVVMTHLAMLAVLIIGG